MRACAWAHVGFTKRFRLAAFANYRCFGWKALAEIGYAVALDVFVHSEYGGCTIRKRVYMIAINASRFALSAIEARQLAQEMISLAKALKIGPRSFEEFLLDDAHPYIVREMARYQEEKEKEQDFQRQSGCVNCGFRQLQA